MFGRPSHSRPAVSPTDAPSNWDRSLDLLARRGVLERARRWYVRGVEEFLKAMRARPLAELTGPEVTASLQAMAARPGLAVGLAEGGGQAAGVGPSDHRPVAATAHRSARSAETFPLLGTPARTLRAMQYAIHTEQSYVDWCHRFLAFCGKTPAERLGLEDVQRFLSHLAVERSVSAKTQGLAYNAALCSDQAAAAATGGADPGGGAPRLRFDGKALARSFDGIAGAFHSGPPTQGGGKARLAVAANLKDTGRVAGGLALDLDDPDLGVDQCAEEALEGATVEVTEWDRGLGVETDA
jgi:hypothetical protein